MAALVVSVGAAGWLYKQNRSLRSKLDAATAKTATAGDEADTRSGDQPSQAGDHNRRNATDAFVDGLARAATRSRPELPKAKKESRLERRKRRMSYVRALLGRLDGETEAEYRERFVPMVKQGLSAARERVERWRKEAERKANVTDDQREKLDKVFDDTYSELLELTNKSVRDGELTPYERNWTGLLSYAGGLGAVLDSAQGRIGKILSPQQQRAIYDHGFEWGEYLGVTAPWERLDPPPPPPNRNGG